MTLPLGRKPRTRRVSTGFFATITSPTTMPTICPMTVARAAPTTSRRGKGPMPKIRTGSRMRLTTAPMPWTIMGPTALPVAWSTRSAANWKHTPREQTVTMVR